MLHFSVFPTELWLSLEEHQYALELIMGRYRKQMLQLMMGKKTLDTKPVLSLHEDHAKVCIHSVFIYFHVTLLSCHTHVFFLCQEVQNQLERICEMGQVMRKAVQVDDQHYCSVQERLAQLEVSQVSIRAFKQIKLIKLCVNTVGNQIEQGIKCFSSVEFVCL